MSQCQAPTADGSRCRRHTVEGSNFCWIKLHVRRQTADDENRSRRPTKIGFDAYTLESMRPDAILIETWRYTDSGEPDETTWSLEDGDDVVTELSRAIEEEVRYMTRAPHRLTSRLVYYGPPQEHEFEGKKP